MDHSSLTRHMDWLYRQALRLCGHTADAQELTQDTLLGALQYPGEPENPQAFLMTLLRRRHADMLRRKYRLPTMLIGDVPDTAVQASPDDDEAAALRRETAYLAGKYREAIVRHYLLGEPVADVARALDIPRGTVLSRLSAGREQLRKGLTDMKEYGMPSCRPERLEVSCNGTPGRHDQPWSLVADDLMRQNILIAAYDEPAAPVDVARHLGIPAAYVEQAVDALVDGGLMRRMGRRVATDFLITTPEQREQGLELQLDLACTHYDALTEPLRALSEAICSAPCCRRLTSRELAMLREYFALRLLSGALYTACRRLVPAEEVFPDRPDGGRWIAQGFRVPMDFRHEDSRFCRYTYGGERTESWEHFMGAAALTLHIYDVQPDLNRYQHGPVGIDDPTLCRLLYALHRGADPCSAGIDPALMQSIPHLIRCGVLRESDGRPECAVPVLTHADYTALDQVRLAQLPVLTDTLTPLLRGIFPALRVPLPAHLTGRVAEFRRYACYAIPMALREEAIRRGDWTPGSAAPAMVLAADE